jgi:hypothetical protein
MALINTINFLPEVFRTDTNQRFLGATLDQLTTNAINVPVNGYIGRTFAPTYKLGDNYVPEPTRNRSTYQLEASVVVKDNNKDIVLNSTYQDLLQGIETNGGFSNNQQRLFKSEYYNYDGHFDYDKFVNYNQYYWMPNGPQSVAVSSGDTPLQATYTVTRNTNINGYTFSSLGSLPNGQVTLARGGTYIFNVDQPGYNFWIQTKPGVNGVDPNINNISTRQIFGVKNNGTDAGQIQFTVPQVTAQDFYTAMPTVDKVSAAVDFTYIDIQNQLLSGFLEKFPSGLDGLSSELANKNFIFISNKIDASYWTTPDLPNDFVGQDNSPITPGSVIVGVDRTSSWKINLVPSGSDYLIQIQPSVAVNTEQKVRINSGETYASAEFWLNANSLYQQIPLITAPLDYLYYQDSSNPDFVGEIKIVDNTTTPINIPADILGKKNYTSPNGVVFTNGLKIRFDSLVVPDTYANNEYYVEGVGTSITLVAVDQLVVPESFGAEIQTQADYITINRGSQDQNAWSRTNRWFHVDVLNAVASYNNTAIDYGPSIPGRRAIIEFEPNLQLFNFGRQAKNNVDFILFSSPATSIISGGTYTIVSVGTTDFTSFGATSNTVGVQFIATRDGTGSDGTGTVTTDAFVQYEGQSSVTIDGVLLNQANTQGKVIRIIFAADYDTEVTNEVWQIDFEQVDSSHPAVYYLRLIPTADDPVVAGENVLVTQGTNAGKTFWFNGSEWFECQEKTSFNQAPLFDIVDANGYSFSDTTLYPGSSFAGTKFFGYSEGTGANDPILGFPLAYQNFNNIGDIVFNNYFDTDSFTYNNTQTTTPINTGYIVKNTDLTSTALLTNWIMGVQPSSQYQITTKFFDGFVIEMDNVNYAFVQIDALPDSVTAVPTAKVFLNNKLLNSNTDYTITNYGIYPVVLLTNMPAIGDKIDIVIFSSTPSSLGYYEVPENLDFNPLNESFLTITLGQLRSHYNKLIENTPISLTTQIPVQDRYLKAQGGTILQQSSPTIYAMTFLSDPVVNYIDSITLARKEYQRFKNKFLTLATTLSGLNYNDTVASVDSILKNINSVKNNNFAWYYSDMVAQGGNYNAINYTVVNAHQTRYEINSIFDVTKLSNRGVLVYHNGVQLLGNNIDYIVSPISPEIIFNITLQVGDSIVIKDYFDTDGNFIPETPVKLGLAQATVPSIYTDTTYVIPAQVIRGHDGSITPAFGDFRDQFLLELEKRIYNNLKTNYSALNSLNLYDTVPGRFRKTDYTFAEWNQLITQNLLQWIGSNNIDYTTNNTYNSTNPWTWNYGYFTDVVDGSFLQGSWRAIYNYWFDTDQPHITPWNMLGFAEEPSWWAERYGPAPYTSGNTTLWEDLEQGYVWNGSNNAAYYDKRFARPGLSGTLTGSFGFIPVDSAGNLLDPTRIGIIAKSNPTSAGNSWSIGQQSPVETAWRRSSDYPYAVQQALALARPAEYFSTQLDLSRFYTNPVTKQFSNIDNQKIAPSLLRFNGDTVTEPGSVLRTAGYINWIIDYVKNLGMDPVAKLKNYFDNFSVQLAYRVAGFTDQKLITVTAEQTSPGSTNASVIIPDENYQVYVGEPVPTNVITYSGVIVTKVLGGYSVAGYDTINPFFTIIPSVVNNQVSSITVNDLTVKVYQTGNDTPSTIPYGTVFPTVQQVADFLVSYERYLTSQGFLFDQFDKDLQVTRNWQLSIQEFLFWVQQNWGENTIIVLNPVFDMLTVRTNGTIVGELTNLPNGSRLLNSNFAPIKSNNFNILRRDYPLPPYNNKFQVSTLDGATGIAFAKLNLIQYETTLIFDNVDDFGDIMYVPNQGTRQYRLKISGAKTGAWDGALSAAGYIYSNPEIKSWQPGTDYRQGDIVLYNNSYYTAPKDIPAGKTFILTSWTKISQSDIQTGLLPSFGHNAQIFQNIYDVDNPPQDEKFQVFSAGLIGFRPRPFLSNLGISVPTQTKFYQGYIKQKGTQNAISSLTKATFGTVNSTVNTYEEWAFRVGQYGDVNSNQYTEFVLDQSVFLTNPVAFTATNNYNTGNIIVNLAVTGNTTTSNVYNGSNIYNTSTSLYSNRGNVSYPADVPTAGYVNSADVNYQVFDITTITALPTLVTGNTIWVAKDATKNWNVFRVNSTGLTATTLKYTLDSYAQLIFNTTHSFNIGDYLALQNFNNSYNGLYQVVGVPTTNSVTIVLSNTNALITADGTLSGLGTVFALKSMIVPTNASVGSNPPIGGWQVGDHQWVNMDTAPGATGWAVYTYNGSSWTRTRQQQPKVDINSVNRTFIYNKINNVILAAIDFIDPAKGKVLNAVSQDIDFQLTTDPAYYNAGTGTTYSDFHWGPDQVGKIWWNLDAVRYIDYEQDQLIYRLNNWGTAFPGSQILVYEWVESSVLPSQYSATVGDGVPLYADDSAYSTYGTVGPTGTITVKYYFWVANKTSINTKANKSNSVYSIVAAIENPQSQGIPYATVLRNDTLALYNVNKYLSGQQSVLHVENRGTNVLGLIHSEYALVQEGNPSSQIPAVIKRKLIDSLAGQDSAGNAVPDPELTPAQSYGISIRPRQSLFVDRTLALSNYITYVNSILITYPVIENKLLTTLDSEEPIPSQASGEYNKSVETYADLGYIDTGMITTGYKVLVNSDSNNSGKWAIYTWNTPTVGVWNQSRVQSYKTNLYWTFADWYQTGYDYTVAPDITVDTLLDYRKLTRVADQYIKVLNNGNGEFVVYYIDSNLNQNLVGIQNGTIQLSTDVIPALEMRQLALAVQNDIFINDLSSNYNTLFFIMIKYALSEQKNLDWVFKTSFISATQYIRALEEFPAYVADNQQYYLDYINEVKPYRTTIRQFTVDYQGNDQYSGDTTDFDLPPYWDANLSVYRSPSGEQYYDNALLSNSNSVYSSWYKNYKSQVIDIVIENPGTGYISPPTISIVGGDGTTANTATAYATINGNYQISNIVITNPGRNYTTTPTVVINGTGTGAKAYAVLRNIYDRQNTGHNLVRSIETTIKFDRVNYTNPNTFVFWSNITTANAGQVIPANTIIVNNNILYLVGNTVTLDANVDFPFANVSTISSSSLNNANDRIIAFNGNINLALTQPGIEYPGVKVDGNTFVGNVYDTVIESFYGNTLGINPYDINVDGGGYVTTFTSHAPEELVPGHMRDNLNLTVYDTANVGFREFNTISGNLQFYRIADANVTSLTSNLNLTDTSILVEDASKLPLPQSSQNTPGSVIINGERITYWRNYALETPTAWTANTFISTNTLLSHSSNLYIVTGNVYGTAFANIASNVTQVSANTLSQIQRGVDGTYTPRVHNANSRVVDSSIQQLVPSSYTSPSNIGISNKTYTVTGNVTYKFQFNGNITANVGDYITQIFANTTVAANLRVLSNTSTTNVAAIFVSGNITTTLSNTVKVNGTTVTGAGIISKTILGTVNSAGNITIAANTVVSMGNIWTSPSSSLDASTTSWANFLKASPSYYAIPGNTP